MNDRLNDRLDVCRGVGCAAAIRWVKTVSGKPCPVDPDLHEVVLEIGAASGPGKRVTLVTEDGKMVTGQETAQPGGTLVRGYRPHWASCPARTQFRKAPRRSEPVV